MISITDRIRAGVATDEPPNFKTFISLTDWNGYFDYAHFPPRCDISLRNFPQAYHLLLNTYKLFSGMHFLEMALCYLAGNKMYTGHPVMVVPQVVRVVVDAIQATTAGAVE